MFPVIRILDCSICAAKPHNRRRILSAAQPGPHHHQLLLTIIIRGNCEGRASVLLKGLGGRRGPLTATAPRQPASATASRASATDECHYCSHHSSQGYFGGSRKQDSVYLKTEAAEHEPLCHHRHSAAGPVARYQRMSALPRTTELEPARLAIVCYN